MMALQGKVRMLKNNSRHICVDLKLLRFLTPNSVETVKRTCDVMCVSGQESVQNEGFICRLWVRA